MRCRFLFLVPGLLVLGLTRPAWTQPSTPAANAAPGELAAPTGDYRIAWLTLEKAWEGQDLKLFLGLRSGKGAVAWFCERSLNGKGQLVWFDRNTVMIDGNHIKGELSGRWACHWPKQRLADFAYKLDGKLGSVEIGGTFSGKLTLAGNEGANVSGSLRGQVQSDAELAKEQAFAPGIDWPSFFGPKFSMTGTPSSRKLVDTLQQARPLWRSEEPIPCGWGTAPDGRYMDRAAFGGYAGGASSPIVARGRIYQYFYRPAGALADEAKVMAEAAQLTEHPIERQLYIDAHRPLADEVVLCLDGATGKTLWKSIFPRAGINLQTHKWRGGNPTPVFADGVLYVQTYTGRILALDGLAGKLLWEHAGAVSQKNWPPAYAAGPVLADGVLVCPVGARSFGLDARTGKELWKLDATGPLVRWTHQGKDYLIFGKDKVAGPATALCVEPKTGKVLWNFPHAFREINRVQVDGDFLVADLFQRNAAAPWKTDFVCYQLKPDGPQQVWKLTDLEMGRDENGLAIASGHAYISTGAKLNYCVEVKTGRLVASQDKGLGHLNQILQVVDGRLFIFPEDHHGSAWFYMHDADPKNFRLLGEGWYPPHPSTTAYSHHGLGFPIVDGRMVIRGHDGIYCYDLRKPPASR